MLRGMTLLGASRRALIRQLRQHLLGEWLDVSEFLRQRAAIMRPGIWGLFALRTAAKRIDEPPEEKLGAPRTSQ